MESMRNMLKPVQDSPWVTVKSSDTINIDVSTELFTKKSRLKAGENKWARIGVNTVTLSPEAIITNAFNEKLAEYKIQAKAIYKSFPSFLELRAIFDSHPDYETELMTCKAFAEIEEQFPNQILEFIILTKEELSSIK